ncbi:hypothetical protein DSO57_1018017 [Entomophthora muscae]|uniref:Uncharacterized protein n=1 Tax=Entomophthora muscae TaxID=34485 RepID=A0ACC2TFK0_9FUNG|nr:hypothetical protein DSO57_1018017 [Entomophthora muscae]
MILPALKFVVFSLALFLLLLWYTSPDLWGKISSSAHLVGSNPASLWDLPSSLLFSREAVVKSLMCDNLDLDVVELALSSSEEVVPPTPPLPSIVQKNLITPRSSKVASPAPTCTPWLLTGLILMGLNAYFPQLSLVSSLWSPLQAAIPVAHWMASWWFVAPGWEPNLVSLAPLSHNTPVVLAKPPCALDLEYFHPHHLNLPPVMKDIPTASPLPDAPPAQDLSKLGFV